jgi:hypothetical protein
MRCSAFPPIQRSVSSLEKITHQLDGADPDGALLWFTFCLSII